MSIFLHNVRLESRAITNETKSPNLFLSNDFLTVYVHQGAAIWEIGGIRRSVKAGDAVLLTGKYPRYLYHIDPAEPFGFYVLNISPKFLFEFGLLQVFNAMNLSVSPVISANTGEIGELFSKIKREKESAMPHSDIFVSALTVSVLILIARQLNLTAAYSEEELHIKTAADYIDAHYCDDLNLGVTAAKFNMSAEAFSKHFKKYTGMPYSRYIRHRRVAKAIALIESTGATVLDIALECGYKSMANFYKAFRDITGRTPSDYKKSRGI